jgi:hypothetical protein
MKVSLILPLEISKNCVHITKLWWHKSDICICLVLVLYTYFTLVLHTYFFQFCIHICSVLHSYLIFVFRTYIIFVFHTYFSQSKQPSNSQQPIVEYKTSTVVWSHFGQFLESAQSYSAGQVWHRPTLSAHFLYYIYFI